MGRRRGSGTGPVAELVRTILEMMEFSGSIPPRHYFVGSWIYQELFKIRTKRDEVRTALAFLEARGELRIRVFSSLPPDAVVPCDEDWKPVEPLPAGLKLVEVKIKGAEIKIKRGHE